MQINMNHLEMSQQHILPLRHEARETKNAGTQRIQTKEWSQGRGQRHLPNRV